MVFRHEAGVDGLFDLTRARHVTRRIPPELERAILSVRRRLQARTSPATRYCLTGAASIRADLRPWVSGRSPASGPSSASWSAMA
jgi:hypothetical protein